MPTLSPQQLWDAIRPLVPDDELGIILTAAVLAESGGRLDAVGDNGHAIGPYQMHDQGRGFGMSQGDRADLGTATHAMLPWFAEGRRQAELLGMEAEARAVHAYLEAERPYGYPHVESPAALRFRDCWREVVALDLPGTAGAVEGHEIEGHGEEMDFPERLGLCEEIRQHLGTPYVFGGKAPGGFDCSGLVTWAARAVGLELGDPIYTSAEKLRQMTEELDPADTRIGDLLFFEHTYDTPGASHVGVSLGAGTGRMLDTHEPGGVQETNIYTDYWQERFLGVGRLPGPVATELPPPEPEPEPETQVRVDFDPPPGTPQEQALAILNHARYETRAVDNDFAWDQVGRAAVLLEPVDTPGEEPHVSDPPPPEPQPPDYADPRDYMRGFAGRTHWDGDVRATDWYPDLPFGTWCALPVPVRVSRFSSPGPAGSPLITALCLVTDGPWVGWLFGLTHVLDTILEGEHPAAEPFFQLGNSGIETLPGSPWHIHWFVDAPGGASITPDGKGDMDAASALLALGYQVEIVPRIPSPQDYQRGAAYEGRFR